MTKPSSIYYHFIICAVFVFFAAQQGGGLLLKLAMPLFVFACALKLAKAFLTDNYKQFFKDFLSKLAVWLLGFAVILGVHQYYKYRLSIAVNQTLAKIEQHNQKTSRYPPVDSLDHQLLKQYRISYVLKNGKPTLFYIDTFAFHSFYFYDFKTKTWTYVAD